MLSVYTTSELLPLLNAQMIIAWPQSESYYKVYHHSKSCIGGRGNFFARCEREKRGSPQNGEGSSFVPPLLGLGERVVLVHHLAEVVASLQGTLLAQVVYNHQGLYVEDQVYKPKGRGYCSSDELSSNKVYATQRGRSLTELKSATGRAVLHRLHKVALPLLKVLQPAVQI